MFANADRPPFPFPPLSLHTLYICTRIRCANALYGTFERAVPSQLPAPYTVPPGRKHVVLLDAPSAYAFVMLPTAH